MIYRQYGKLSKPVSLIGLGTLRFSSDKADFEKNTAIIEKALDLGVNYFDTCSEYACGSSESALGAVFRGIEQENLVITAKSRLSIDPTADDVLRRVDSDLKNLHVARIDLFHMWCIMNLEEYHQITAPGGPYEGAVRAREQGLISHICCSVHCSGQDLEKIVADGLFDGVIIGFNAMNYRHRLGGLRAASASNMGIAIMNPMAGGMIPRQPEYFQHLKGKDGNVASGAIQFLTAHEEISTILIGARTPDDLTAAVCAADGPQERSKTDWYALIDSQPRLSDPLCILFLRQEQEVETPYYTIDYGEWKTGCRTEGLVNSACSFGYKIGNGVGSALMGLILEIFGYVGEAAVQTESAVMSIHLCFAWIPIGIFAACFLILRFYNLDNEFEGILRDLQTRAAKNT